MTSKKYRKKLKEQYNSKNVKQYSLFYKDNAKDRDIIVDYFKNNPNRIITAKELVINNNLKFDTSSSICHSIKYINNNNNLNIQSKKGRYGGYIYYA